MLRLARSNQPANLSANRLRVRPVKIYTDATDLVSNPFRDLGEVSGDDCQSSTEDSPPNLNTARKRLQIKAAGMKANAVLLQVRNCLQHAGLLSPPYAGLRAESLESMSEFAFAQIGVIHSPWKEICRTAPAVWCRTAVATSSAGAVQSA